MEEKISIVIPAYNEEKMLERCIRRVERHFTEQSITWELIIINDGSKDKTGQIIEKWSNRNNKIKVFSYPDNKGKGYAIRQGLMEANYDTILLLDVDLSVSPVYLQEAIKKFPKAHIIYGDRTQMLPQPFHRLFAGKVWKVLVWMTTGMYLDSQSPFKVLRLEKIFFTDLKIDGFAYDVELLYKAKKQKYKIESMKVSYANNEDSRVTLKKTVQMFVDLIKIRFN